MRELFAALQAAAALRGQGPLLLFHDGEVRT